MATRERLSATVDPDLVAAGRQAVRSGRAPNLSAWVNDALQRQVDHDRRLAALDEFVSTYEAEHGVITDEAMATAGERLREAAIRVDRQGEPRRSRRGAA